MLLRKITQDQYDELDPAIQAEYNAGEDAGTYLLDTEEPTELKNALDRERENGVALKAANKELTEKLTTSEASVTAATTERDAANKKFEELQTASLESGNDVTAAVAKIQAEFAARDKERDEQVAAKFKEMEDNQLAGHHKQKVMEIAAEWGGSDARLLVPFLMERTKAVLTDGIPSITWLDEDGSLGTMTKDDLRKAWEKDSSMSKLMVVSQATGSAGDSGGDNKSKGSSAAHKAKTLDDLSPEAQQQLWREDRQM